MRKSNLCFEIAALLVCLHFLVGTTKAYPAEEVSVGAESPDVDYQNPDFPADSGNTEYTDEGSTTICTGDRDKTQDCITIQEAAVQKTLQNAFIGRKIALEKDENVVFNFLFPSGSSPSSSGITTNFTAILGKANNTIGQLLRRPESLSANAVVRANAYSLRYCHYQAIANMSGSELWCGDLQNENRTTLIATSTTSADRAAVQMSPNGQQVFYANDDNGTGIWVTNLETMHSALLVRTEFPVTRFYVDWENARAFTVEARNAPGGSTESNLTSWDLQEQPLSPVKPSVQVWRSSNSTIKSITAEPRTKSLYWKVDNGSILKLEYNFTEAETEPRVILKGNATDDGDFQGEPMMVNNDTLIYVSLVDAKKGENSTAVQLRLSESVTNVIHFRNIDPKAPGELEMTAFYSSDSHLIAIGMNESCRDCSHLCVPVGPSESRCTCPYEFEIEGGEDSKICRTPENLTVVFEDVKKAEWVLAEYNVMTKQLWTLTSSKSKMELLPYFGSEPQKCYKTENGTDVTSVACIGESGAVRTLKAVGNSGEILAITSNKRSKWSVYWLDSDSGCLKEDTDSSTYTMYCDQKLRQKSGLLTRLDPTENLLFVIEQASKITVINWATRQNLIVQQSTNLAFGCRSDLQVDFNQGQSLSIACGNSAGRLNYSNLYNISLFFSNLGIDATSVFEDVDKRQWYLSIGAIYTKKNKSSSVAYKVYGLPDTLRPQSLQKPLSVEDYSNSSSCSNYFKVDKFESGPRFTCYCPYELPILRQNEVCGSIKVTSLSQQGSQYRFDLYDSENGHLESYFNLTEKPVSSTITVLGSNRTCYVDHSRHLKCSNDKSFSNTSHLDVSSNVTQLVKPNIQIGDELYWIQTENSRTCLYFSKTPESSISQIKLGCLDVNSDQEIRASTLDIRTMTLFWCQKNIKSTRSILQWIPVKHMTSSKSHSQHEIECMDIALSNDANARMSTLYVSNPTSITSYEIKLDIPSKSDVTETERMTSTSTFTVHIENPKEILKTTEPAKSLTFFDNYLLWVQNDTSEHQVKLLDLSSIINKSKAQPLPISNSNASLLQFVVAQAPSRITLFTSPCGTNACQDQRFCIPSQNSDFECWCSVEDGVQECPTPTPPTTTTSTTTSTTTTPTTTSTTTTPTNFNLTTLATALTTEFPPPIDCESPSSECESLSWIWILLGCFLAVFITCAVGFRFLVKRPNEQPLHWSNTLAYLRSLPRLWALRLRPERSQSYDSVRGKEANSIRLDARSSTAPETT